MKLLLLFFVLQYSIYLNCFFSNFNIDFLCANIATVKYNSHIIFYCKEKDGIDIYKYDTQTKKSSLFGRMRGNKNTTYFVDFIENIEISIRVTTKSISIRTYSLTYKRSFLRSKVLKNNSSISEYTEGIFVDINCDGYKDIVIPYSHFYKVYLTVKKHNAVKFKLFKRLYFGFIETRRKESFYDNVWFKIGYALPKLSSFKYKTSCYNLVHYLSAGIIMVYKDGFKRRVSKIMTIKNKDKYEEFIVYPRPEPFIYCSNRCSIIHFDYKRGIIYVSPLYYPYESAQKHLVKGTILNFTLISKNIFWVIYIPKLNFFDFYELLTQNVLDIKLALVIEQNKVFNIVYELSLRTKINLKEEGGFITVGAGCLVCATKLGDNLKMIFSDKDAVYKYTLNITSINNKVKEIEKVKSETPFQVIETYKCLDEPGSLVVFSYVGKINYLQQK